MPTPREEPADASPTPGGFDVHDAYREHGAVIYAFALNAVADRAEAEDLVQEVFTRAWRAADRYDSGRGSTRTWLFAIARNLVLDAHRARSRRPRVIREPEAGEEPVLVGPEDSVVDRLRVAEALARLSPEHRQVVVALHLQGRSYADIAATSGVPVATLRTRMYYALRAMRETLDELETERGTSDG